jgi:hypothetical protein
MLAVRAAVSSKQPLHHSDEFVQDLHLLPYSPAYLRAAIKRSRTGTCGSFSIVLYPP